MVEIQCSSCHTRYRIDERVLPQETPTFKCSRCGHVFSIEPRGVERAASEVKPKPAGPKARRPAKARAAALISEERKAAETATEPPEPPPVAAPEQPPQPDPLARPFPDRTEEPEPGESLAFDFNVESDEQVAPPDDPTPEADEWEVGDSQLDFRSEPDDRLAGESHEITSPAIEAPGPPRDEKRESIQPDVAMPSLGSAVHSAGFFLAGFFFAALAFGALSLIIAGEPAASAALLARVPGLGDHFVDPASPAVKIALRDVRAEYRNINGQQAALVITGQALNVGARPLHEIQIAVNLLGGAKQALAKQAVFCGNNLSGRMISQMTPRELEFFQRLGPPKAFLLQPSAAYPFTIVFVQPPT